MGYQMDRLYRNGEYRVFHRTDDPYSKITVINTEESNIRFIDKDNEFLNHMFEVLIEDYEFDIDNAAIYYLFDRDPESNTDNGFIKKILGKLTNARDGNEDMARQGMLLLSYPCIESFIGMNLLDGSIDYCWRTKSATGAELKYALNRDGLIQNKINEGTILHCAMELMSSLEQMGIDTRSESILSSMDDFSVSNEMIYDWQKSQYAQKRQYGLLSLMIISLLDLGVIEFK